MSNYKTLFGAILSSLLLSGTAFGHGVSNDISGDILNGHSADHIDPVLLNPSKMRAPDMGLANKQNSEDIIRQITVLNVQLTASKSSPPDAHSRSGHDNQEDMVHEITWH